MDWVAPSSCADFRAPKSDSQFPMPIFKPCFKARQTAQLRTLSHSFGPLTRSLTSLLHTLIHPYHYFGIVTLIAFSFAKRHLIRKSWCFSCRQGCTVSATKLRPALPLFHQDLLPCAHSTFPTHLLPEQIPSSVKYHLYNTVHYIRSHHVSMYKSLQASIHPSIHLLLLSTHGSLACVAVYTLVCNYHHHSLTTPPLPCQSLILCIFLPSNLFLFFRY